jgi:hypothetical protein
MTAARPRWFRRAPLAAALLALCVQLMFPAGFMAASAGEARGFPIVICTAQGSVTMDWDSAGGVHKQAPVKPMAHCPFAGHATSAPPPVPQAVAIPAAFEPAAADERPYLVFPGRGLAAPPPPAIGPPARV